MQLMQVADKVKKIDKARASLTLMDIYLLTTVCKEGFSMQVKFAIISKIGTF